MNSLFIPFYSVPLLKQNLKTSIAIISIACLVMQLSTDHYQTVLLALETGDKFQLLTKSNRAFVLPPESQMNFGPLYGVFYDKKKTEQIKHYIVSVKQLVTECKEINLCDQNSLLCVQVS